MSTIKTDTLQNVAGTLSVPVATVVNGSAKAWVNFNGTGTVAIRAAFNVSSITDNGAGQYTINFTTAMPDANYSWSGSGNYGSGGTGNTGMTVEGAITAPQTASNLAVWTKRASTIGDATIVCIAIFR